MNMSGPELCFAQVTPANAGRLAVFFSALRAAGDEKFFHPHPLDDDAAARIAHYDGSDLYCAAFHREEIVAYGMLRGWDEGYVIPSLGISVHPAWRNRGVGRALMTHLHLLAAKRGATRVRLTVQPANQAALCLYRSLQYQFQIETPERWIGLRELRAMDAFG